MSWQIMGQVKVAAQSLATLNTILDELARTSDLGAKLDQNEMIRIDMEWQLELGMTWIDDQNRSESIRRG